MEAQLPVSTGLNPRVVTPQSVSRMSPIDSPSLLIAKALRAYETQYPPMDPLPVSPQTLLQSLYTSVCEPSWYKSKIY